MELSGAASDNKLGWTARLTTALGSAFTVNAFNVNGAMLRDIREALTPQKKEVKPTRQRRG